MHFFLSSAFSKVGRDDVDNVEKGISEDASTFLVQSFIPSLSLQIVISVKIKSFSNGFSLVRSGIALQNLAL